MIARLAFDHVLAAAGTLSAAPQILVGLSELLRDPQVELDRVCEQVKLDPALAAAVVRVSNSVMFGFGGRVASVEEAVSRVGLSEVMRLVGVATVGRLVDRALPGHAIRPDELRRSLVLHALAAEQLALRCGVEPRLAYTAGLLRAIGIMVLERVMATDGFEVQRFDPESFASYQDWEIAQVGMTHEEAAVIAFEGWRCAPELVEAVRTQAKFVGAHDDSRLAGVINLAGAGLVRAGRALPGDEMFWTLTDAKLAALGLDEPAWTHAMEVAAAMFEKVRGGLF